MDWSTACQKALWISDNPVKAHIFTDSLRARGHTDAFSAHQVHYSRLKAPWHFD
ncbi:hypothetical protein [Endozoicomonas sp. SCSIO W0465]|uniref:hypothetical protein n=1 Tax=Endozoicomonas sp. SCSIO W0465 TaxID=2918516 RepID=UPI0020758206|nr:hypothetical protein [Endozoicomonas sp. SCSIO W0465]USE35623.1 hypothetical protein MJO57_26640 [Endozoicomonas sp. SCSIO W0465]